jgi:DNA-directed RNA polymerase specialized sigma24 family protein
MRVADPQQMELIPLALCCEEETARFFHPDSRQEPQREPDPRYCFELFRRALAGQDPLAWKALCQQYAPLVAGWVTRHPQLERSGGIIQDLVDDAFRRMWSAIKPGRFRRFHDLASLLAYLKMCAHSAVVEEARKADFLARMADVDLLSEKLDAMQRGQIDSPVDRLAFALEHRESVWKTVNSGLRNEKERVLIHCLFELNLKPKKIAEDHKDLFIDVKDVYTTRQVVLERLARNPAVQALVAERA